MNTSRRSPLLALLTLGAVSGLAAPVVAGEMEEVTVLGRYLSIDKLDAVKTPTPILNVPQSLSILTEEQIRDQAFTSIGDLLRYTPGLAISQGEGHRDAIIIRGIQTTADFFVDGLRDDVQYYRPLYNVEQVEILRGANALLFGRGGGGGVINRVQKQPDASEQFTTVQAGADTFGAYTGSFDANVPVSDDVAFRLNGYYASMENHRNFYDGTAFALNPTIRFSLGDDTSAVIAYEYVDDDRVIDRGVPSQDVVGGPDIPLQGYRDTFFGSPDQNLATLQANLVRARFDHAFSEDLRGNLTVQWADYDKLYQNLYASEEVAVTNGSFTQVELDGYLDTTDRENLIAQANLVAELETGPLRHTLLVGAEFGNQQTANARQDNVFAQNGSDQLFVPFTDPLVIPEFGFSVPVRAGESDVNFTSLYLQDQVTVTEHLKLLLGVRYDEFDIDVMDFVEENDGDAIDGSFSRSDKEVTPRLGFIFKPGENTSLYASYSETFLPRSGDQFLTLDLTSENTRPQFFENREVGFKWDIRSDLALTAAVFELTRESYTSVDPADASRIVVIDGSAIEGFEFQLSGRMTDYWTLVTGYSNLDGRVAVADGSGFDGRKTRQTPEHMFSIWNSFVLTNRLRLGIGATYQDSFFVSEDNSVEVPDYTRVDAAVYYQANASTRIQLNVENLLDETYFPDAHSNDNISTGRPLNARLSVVVEF